MSIIIILNCPSHYTHLYCYILCSRHRLIHIYIYACVYMLNYRFCFIRNDFCTRMDYCETLWWNQSTDAVCCVDEDELVLYQRHVLEKGHCIISFEN